MTFRKFDISATTRFAIVFRSKWHLYNNGYMKGDVKLFSISIIFKHKTYLIEV